ncbi:AAA family ATPase [Agromyces sp. Leaf222]|uniref:AAA family ATPase n=1 Tax=Agromyces sp. Leaf222 TaxID=1735688 RepID=UPI0006FF5267|nr:AAA family ATPase [Agromyces sp. Leaf222]KQM82727.1 phosphotransferase [Agromyces sp. Leaf222]
MSTADAAPNHARVGAAEVFLITGVMAAGKSTVAQVLAGRLPYAAHVRGDGFRRMLVSGRAEMSNPLSPAAEAQLELRHRLAATVADAYADAGISAVVQDLYLGEDLERMVGRICHRPLSVIVLAPRPDVVEAREASRPKRGYGDWSVADFDAALRETPRLGLWIDSSELSVEATVDLILERRAEARVSDG